MEKQAFISWSRDHAMEKARALKQLLADVLPEARIFMSEQDIPAGSLWLDGVTSALTVSVAGVIIVTSENATNPWLHFEAGALSNRVDRKMVIPLLAGVEISALNDTPLSSFQALKLEKHSILTVCKSFCRALEISRSEEQIERALEKWWDEYEPRFSAAAPVDLKKKAATVEDVHRLVSSLQSQARAQSDAIASIQRRLDTISPPSSGALGMTPRDLSKYTRGLLRSDDLADRATPWPERNERSWKIILQGESHTERVTFSGEPEQGGLVALSDGSSGIVMRVEHDDHRPDSRILYVERLRPADPAKWG